MASQLLLLLTVLLSATLVFLQETRNSRRNGDVHYCSPISDQRSDMNHPIMSLPSMLPIGQIPTQNPTEIPSKILDDYRKKMQQLPEANNRRKRNVVHSLANERYILPTDCRMALIREKLATDLSFNVSTNDYTSSVQLWFHTNPQLASWNGENVLLQVEEFQMVGGVRKSVWKSDKFVSVPNEWQSFDLSGSTNQDDSEYQSDMMKRFLITCENCRSLHSGPADFSGSLKPFIQIESLREKRQLSDREEDFGTEGTCCVQKLTVNFTDLGWMRSRNVGFIIEPETVDVNICSGECNSGPAELAVWYHLITQQLKNKNNGNLNGLRTQFSCCHPKETNSIPFLYFINGEIKLEHLDVQLSRCGC